MAIRYFAIFRLIGVVTVKITNHRHKRRLTIFLEIKNFEKSEATVIDSKTVEFNGQKVSFNEWGQTVTGWSSICIYEWAILKSSGKTLHAIRAQKMQDLEKQAKAA